MNYAVLAQNLGDCLLFCIRKGHAIFGRITVSIGHFFNLVADSQTADSIATSDVKTFRVPRHICNFAFFLLTQLQIMLDIPCNIKISKTGAGTDAYGHSQKTYGRVQKSFHIANISALYGAGKSILNCRAKILKLEVALNRVRCNPVLQCHRIQAFPTGSRRGHLLIVWFFFNKKC